MSLKSALKILLYIFCTLLVEDLFASTVLNHIGFNDGGVIWLVFMTAVYVFIGLVIVFFIATVVFKSQQANRILKKISGNKDALWDKEFMEDHAKQTFLAMQLAWEKRNLKHMKKSMTPELYSRMKDTLNSMILNKTINVIVPIEIKDVRIIGCEDYKDDSKDRYIAYIKGTIIDYTIDETTGIIIKNDHKSYETFKDTYHFVRINYSWVLEEIDNLVTIWDVINTRNYKEE